METATQIGWGFLEAWGLSLASRVGGSPWFAGSGGLSLVGSVFLLRGGCLAPKGPRLSSVRSHFLFLVFNIGVGF